MHSSKTKRKEAACVLGLVVPHCSGFQRQPLWEVARNHLEGDAPAAHAGCPGVSALPHVELV